MNVEFDSHRSDVEDSILLMKILANVDDEISVTDEELEQSGEFETVSVNFS